MDQPQTRIKIKTTTHQCEEDEFFTLYNITVQHEGQKKKVPRRFREFRALNDCLLREFAFTPLPAFPFNALAEMFIGESYLVSSRMVELEKWLNALFAIPKVSGSHFLTIFLNLYDLSDKVAVVTGANTGLGKQAALVLAENRCQVVIACRSVQRGEQAATEIRQKTGSKTVTVMPMDLSSFESIHKFVATFKESFRKVDYLINNAGLVSYEGLEGVTREGFGMIPGVNFIGTALLTLLMLDSLSTEGRVVNVSSAAAFHGLNAMRWGDAMKTPDSGAIDNLQSYQFSKMMLSAWTEVLADKLKKTKISVFSLHPGTIATDIWRSAPEFFQWGVKRILPAPDSGIIPILYCALEKSLPSLSGHYFNNDCTDQDADFRTYLAGSGQDIHSLVWSELVQWIGKDFDFEVCPLLH